MFAILLSPAPVEFIIPYLDKINPLDNNADSLFLESGVLVRFGGRPRSSDDGMLVYVFKSLLNDNEEMNSLHNASIILSDGDIESNSISDCLMERKYIFTSASEVINT